MKPQLSSLWLAVLLAICLALVSQSGGLSGQAEAIGQPLTPLQSLLDPDGSLNLTSGFRGSLDPRGWTMVLDAAGRPRFVPATDQSDSRGPNAPLAPGDENWDNRFGSLGANLAVRAIAVYGTDVYVGGGFTSVGAATVNHIAKWNGTSWSALGQGVNDWVYALAVDGSGNLYAGGLFTQATNTGGGAVTVSYLAKWNGTTWSSVGKGVNDWVRALAVSGNNVYVGGYFTTATNANNSTIIANYVAQWNGSSWQALGDGVDQAVYALVASGNVVYAGGLFTTATDGGGLKTVNSIARWNGSAWSALGSGVSGCSSALCDVAVYALALTAGGDLYVGGTFTHATDSGGAQTVNHLARWNGTSWSAVSGGVGATSCPSCTDAVWAIAVNGGRVYVAGDFTTAGVWPANRIARWDGATWSSLGSGLSYVAYAVGVVGNDVSVGGEFTSAGGKSSYYFGQYHEPSTTTTPTVTRTPTPTPTRTPTPSPTVFPTVDFVDVPNPPTPHWAWSFIQGLYGAGVTVGCVTTPPLYFCPTDLVNRDQMAVFFVRAKYGKTYAPPAATGIFADVPTTYWAANHIEKAYQDGMVTACGVNPLRFCPSSPIPRDLKAQWLLLAKHGPSYLPPAGSSQQFADIPASHPYYAWINQLFVEGITSGCVTSNDPATRQYCPNMTITRDQMSVFLVRVFNLPRP